jgi:hypothetical protein
MASNLSDLVATLNDPMQPSYLEQPTFVSLFG